MPDFDRYRVHILCEDKEHDYFIHSFFKVIAVINDDIRFVG